MADLPELLEALSDELNSLRVVQVGGESFDIYRTIAVAAIAKSFDFARSCVAQRAAEVQPFFVVATLRGVTEDLIVLAALASWDPEERNALLAAWMGLNVIDGIGKQATFFDNRQTFQPVLQPAEDANERRAELKAEMVNLWKRHGVNPGPAGTGNVRSMAQSAGVEDMYDFMYALGSRLVHFTPGVLLRMGWGDFDSSGGITVRFSAANFDGYYAAVAAGYGPLLFAHLVDHLAEPLQLPLPIRRASAAIRDAVESVRRWPELVTYEEMNVRLPSPILTAALSVMRDEKRSVAQP